VIYSALCIDNSKYYEKGTITVRIFAYYNSIRTSKGKSKQIDDLSSGAFKTEGTDHNLITENLSEDFEALVYAPIGGGRNYGIFMLPQINSRGIVAFLDADFGKPIWLGSYFQPIRNPNNYKDIQAINFPSDKEEDGTNKDGSVAGSANMDNSMDKTIVIRTKHTDSGNLDWQTQDTENLVIINDTKIKAKHITEWDNGNPKKYQEFVLDGENEAAKIETLDENGKTVVSIEANKFSITLYDGSEEKLKIDGTTNGELNINTANQQQNVNINGNEKSFVLYDDLKDIVDKFENHIHIGSVITTPPLDATTAAVSSQIANSKMNMKATYVKGKH
jgi:hypothetical protein